MTRAVARMSARTGAGSGDAPGARGARTVRDLFRSHGLQVWHGCGRRSAASRAEVLVEMPLDLPLGLGDEAEAGAIAGERRERADREGAGVPEGIQQARARVRAP